MEVRCWDSHGHPGLVGFLTLNPHFVKEGRRAAGLCSKMAKLQKAWICVKSGCFIFWVAPRLTIAVNPACTRVYVANASSGNVSVIDTATNTVIGAPIPVGTGPRPIAVNPAGTRVYVVNWESDNVSVIDTATNTVVGTPILDNDVCLQQTILIYVIGFSL